MAYTNVKITEKNLNELNKLYKKLKNPKPLLEDIGKAMVSLITESFEAETSPEGEKWQEHAESTKNRALNRALKRRLKNPIDKDESKKMILHDSGQLKGSIEPIVKGDSVIINASKEYAAIHQFGGMAGRNRKVKIPARPFMPVDAEGNLVKKAEEEIEDIIIDYVDN
jgi:phage virion morphogenesis protein